MASIEHGPVSDWRRDWIVCPLLALATLVVFWPVLGYGFIEFDDGIYVFENPHVYEGLSPGAIAWALAPQWGLWHPLTWLSYMTEVEFFGVAPRVHHAVGLLLHVATTLALYLAFRRMTGASVRSGAIALLFAIHPLHVEPVVWISSRKDLLSGLFFALTLLAYVHYVREPRRSRLALVAACMALGLLGKSMLVTTPFVLLLLDGWPLQRVDWSDFRRSAAGLVREKVALFALSIAASAMAVHAANLREAPLAARFVNGISAYGFYVAKTLLPTDLAIFYPASLGQVSLFQLAAVGLSGLFFTALAIRFARDRPYLVVGWLWYLGMMVPVSGFVSFAGHFAADRYTYLPLIGLFLVAAWGVAEISESSRPARITVAVATPLALGALMVLSSQQVSHWKSSERMFEHTLSVTSGNWPVHQAFAMYLAKRGEDDRAIQQYSAALEINPDDWVSHNNLGQVYSRQRRFAQAITHYQRALERFPNDRPAEGASSPPLRADYAAVHFNLALSLAQLGRDSEARRHRAEAIRVDPQYERQRVHGLD